MQLPEEVQVQPQKDQEPNHLLNLLGILAVTGLGVGAGYGVNRYLKNKNPVTNVSSAVDDALAKSKNETPEAKAQAMSNAAVNSIIFNANPNTNQNIASEALNQVLNSSSVEALKRKSNTRIRSGYIDEITGYKPNYDAATNFLADLEQARINADQSRIRTYLSGQDVKAIDKSYISDLLRNSDGDRLNLEQRKRSFLHNPNAGSQLSQQELDMPSGNYYNKYITETVRSGLNKRPFLLSENEIVHGTTDQLESSVRKNERELANRIEQGLNKRTFQV